MKTFVKRSRFSRLRRICCLLLLFVLVGHIAATTTQAVAAAVADPLEHVRSTVDHILAILKEKSDDPAVREERRKRIMASVEEQFDFREMSQRTLAAQWKQISATEQDQFVSLFSKLLERTYIAKVESYSGEEIVYKGQKMEDGSAVVETGVMRNNIEIPINYRLGNAKGQWKVYDVIIENVSLIRNYRSQFQSILGKEKFSGLIKRMQEKIDKGDEERK